MRMRRWDPGGPAFRRRRRGRGFSYTDVDGLRLTDEAALRRIRGLAIPPARPYASASNTPFCGSSSMPDRAALGMDVRSPGTGTTTRSKEENVTNEPSSPVKDKNYNLVTVLQASLHYAWQLEQYIADADNNGDTELAEWFRKIQANNVKAGDQGKHMLAARLAKDEA